MDAIEYEGHYIVITNIDDEYTYYICPTSANGEIEKIKNDSFERARKSFGTDQDIIFIDR